MAAPGKKIACVVGATGNQGGSVARRFLEAGFHVKALTRNTTSAAATKLAEQGAELVSVDLGDVETLKPAFAGANVIFSVTNYWEPFFRPDCRAAAEQQGVSCREYAGEVERLQGRNISDAAASTVASLDSNGFLASTLSHAERCSGGKFKDLYHFDAKADIFPTYVQEKYPELAAKMSCIQTGFFYTSFNILPNSYFGKQADGSVEMAFPTSPSKAVPHFDPVGDMGNFAYAVYQMPAGKAYMAAGTISTWPEFLAAWSKVSGYPVKYREITTDEMVTATPDRECGIEVAAMFAYSSDPGYDGAMDLLTAQDIRKAGIECPMTTWPEWAARQDWKAIMERLG